MRTTMLRCVGVLLAMLVPAVSARAAGWERLPNGEWGFTTELTTSGLFTCLSAEYYIAGGSCSANGNTLVLTSGQSTMTVQFTGLTRSILATNVRSDPFALGTLTKTFTGDPFTIPLMKSQHAELFRFSILLSSPTGIQSSLSAGYTALDRTYLPYNCCDYYSTYARVGIPGQPAGLGYSFGILDNVAGRDVRFDTTPSIVTARVGLVPEPSTYVLMATGLFAIGAISRRRRNQHPS